MLPNYRLPTTISFRFKTLGCGHIDTLPHGNSHVSLREFQDEHRRSLQFFNFPFECTGIAVRRRINVAAT